MGGIIPEFYVYDFIELWPLVCRPGKANTQTTKSSSYTYAALQTLPDKSKEMFAMVNLF